MMPIAALVLVTSLAAGQSVEDETVNASVGVLKEITEIPLKGIPHSILKDAYGLVIIPDMLKGGFIVGVKHGKGVVLTRDENNNWRAPVFVSMTGGSVGWQIGIQASDVILVFRTKRSVEGMLRGKFTVGADAAVAAGPVGREMSAATDAQLKAEILSYSRSRGLFAGLALDGALLQIDNRSTQAFYAEKQGGIPEPAMKLVTTVAQLTGTTQKAGPAPAPAVVAPADKNAEREAVRQQLIESQTKLLGVLDPAWKNYLALPADVYRADVTPTQPAFDQTLGKFATVAGEPQFKALSDRPEFRETHTLLLRFAALRDPVITLPPPPK